MSEVHDNSLANLKPAWQPGQSGNPAGRRPAGLFIREWVNQLIETPIPELKKIATDDAETPARRLAAQRLLRAMECPDPADFTAVLNGELTIEQLREKGVNTQCVKRIRQRRKVRKAPNGAVETTVATELELRDTSGEDFDRVVNQTAGTPRQSMDVTSGDKPVKAFIGVDVDKV